MCRQMCASVSSGRREEEGTYSSSVNSKMYISGAISNTHKTPNEIIKNGAIVDVRILVEQLKL